MLSRRERLPKTEIPALLRAGRSLSHDGLSLRYRQVGAGPSGRAAPSRFAFVVSGKKVKRAVDRNLTKRRARSIVRKHLAEIKSGFEAMIFLDDSFRTLAFAAAEEKLVSLLRRVKII